LKRRGTEGSGVRSPSFREGTEYLGRTSLRPSFQRSIDRLQQPAVINVSRLKNNAAECATRSPANIFRLLKSRCSSNRAISVLFHRRDMWEESKFLQNFYVRTFLLVQPTSP